MRKITISGVIGWDATPAMLREDLEQAGGDDIEVLINSPGGFVSDGIEMFNLLRRYEGNSTARISGYAASMASYIPLACDRRIAEDNAVYMIHNVFGGVYGDHNDILKYGAVVKSMSGMIARTYAKHTGMDLEEIARLMDDETWFFGQEMVEAGFVDEIIETEADKDRDGTTALAKSAFIDCITKISADRKRVKNDLARAETFSAMAGEIITNPELRPRGEKKPQAMSSAKIKEVNMTIQEFKEKYPDQVKAILDEAAAGTEEKINQARDEGHQAGHQAGKKEGAEGERQRIADVRAQLIPGHEALIEELAGDGKTTGAEAAQQVVAAERAAKARHLEQFKADGQGQQVPDASAGDGGGKPPSTAPLEERAKAEWDKDGDLRAEFGDDFNAYLAYRKATEAGYAKQLGK
jgi:ATP-dependent Clp protease, protease subunit